MLLLLNILSSTPNLCPSGMNLFTLMLHSLHVGSLSMHDVFFLSCDFAFITLACTKIATLSNCKILIMLQQF